MFKKLLILFAILFTQTVGYGKDAEKPKKNPEAEVYKWLRTTAEVIATVEEKAYRKVDISHLTQDMLKAGCATIDAHTSFLPNFEEVAEATSGKFSGVGISIISKANEDAHLLIVGTIDDGPSQKAGIEGGDKIVEVNGEKLQGLSSDEVISKIKGKVGTKVKLKIIRDKKPLEFEVKRDIIKDQSSYCYHFKDHDVFYLGLKLFTETSPRQMKKLLEKTNEGKYKGIILDLRSNPGGVLESAVDTASLFIPKGSKVVITKDNKGKIVQEYKTQSNPTLKRPVPIFLLINNFTASASEIVAGALRHYSNEAGNDAKSPLRVFIVGTTTFGKGSVQEIIPLSNGCALKQTSLMYFLPDHTSIQAKGIEPDFLIKPKITPTKEMKWVSELYGKETSLKHHVTAEEIEKNAKGESAGYAHEIDQTTMKKQAEEKAKQEKEKDDKEKYDKDKAKKKRLEDIATNPQIQACVNMISMLDLAKTAQPEDVSTRKKSLEFLKAHYLTDTPTEIEEIK